MPSTPTRDDLRRWVENQRAAAEREQREVREKGTGRDSIAAALDLIDLAGRLHGWPIPEDHVRRREAELARERWARLRRNLAGR